MQVHKHVITTDVMEMRREKREAFLKAMGLGHVTMQSMQDDASFRRYYRLVGADRPLLMMEDPTDRPPVPPLVMVEPFIAIADHLRMLGLHSPKIIHRDIPNGLLIIEDFGDDTYSRLLDNGADPKPLYELAVDALIHLHNHPKRDDLKLGSYDGQLLIDGVMLLMDWYYPALTGKQPTEALKESFTNVWRGLFKNFPKEQETIVLRDYHSPNLMLVAGEKGLNACGIIDFQDALKGQFSYDLMSLLEDARRDVAEDLREHLYKRYLAGVKLDEAKFAYSYRVMAAQRHARVLGVFVRLNVRDGKPRYLKFIPHVHKLFVRTLNTPALEPLKQWFKDNNIDMEQPLNLKENKA